MSRVLGERDSVMIASEHASTVLADLGAHGDHLDQLRSYSVNPFRLESILGVSSWPLAEESHVDDWRVYASESGGSDLFRYLQAKLTQLNVPIQEGVSASTAYRKLSRKGEPFREDDFGGGLELTRPDAVELFIHEHPAGALPVLATSERADFVSLFRALACRSEPREVSRTVNAQMIAGLNNWDRIARYKKSWESEQNHPFAPRDAWPSEMGRVAKESPGRFRDRLILVYKSPYSGVAASEVGLALDDAEWIEHSMKLRVEHEFTHYATKRLFGSMRLNFHDELIADCMGMTHALGNFSKNAFATFMGLSRWPELEPEARAHAYRADLDDEAFSIAGQLALRAAAGLERICERFYRGDERPSFLLALCQLGLTELASREAETGFEQALERAHGVFSEPKGTS